MPQYRTVEAITYVEKGKVVSVAADRSVELTEDQAEKLGDKVVEAPPAQAQVFPNGSPVPAVEHKVQLPEVDPKTLVSGLPRPKK